MISSFRYLLFFIQIILHAIEKPIRLMVPTRILLAPGPVIIL